MDGWNKFLKRCPSNIAGSSLLHSPKLTFDEPFCVASPAHSHCSSANNPNLVLYGSGGAGIQRRLIGVGLLWSELGRRQSLINSRSLRLTHAPFPTFLDRGQSLNTFLCPHYTCSRSFHDLGFCPDRKTTAIDRDKRKLILTWSY